VKITICAVGRLRRGPERALVDDYLDRFTRTGRPVGLGPAVEAEIDERKAAAPAEQAVALTRACRDGAPRIGLDERGTALTSSAFAELLADWRDAGRSELAFLIGGADGLAPGLRASCDRRVSFGPMVWPHMLARVMLAEQLYRAATILAGTPYHRG